jgi:hypothetical protein
MLRSLMERALSTRMCVRLTLLISLLMMGTIPADVGAEVGVGDSTLNLSCLSASSCLLDNEAIGVDKMSKQETSASPASPVTVSIEFVMNPDQVQLALLPPTIDELVIDLVIQEEIGGVNSPDIIVDFWLGPSTNQWTLDGGSPSSPRLGAYRILDAELDLSRGRLLRPGDSVGMRISFEIDQPVTWELYLRGDSRVSLPIEWSVDVAASNVDEPSSAGSPVELSDVEDLTYGALLDADQDCFRFQLGKNLRAMTIIVHWSSVPLEIEQPHTPPELIRQGGATPRNPAVKTTYEAGEQISEIRYEEPPEGSYLACWTGSSNRFQAYSWFARLSLMGIGSSSPSEFLGEANWLAGEAYVGESTEVMEVSSSGAITVVIALLGTAAVFAGFAVPSNFRWSKRLLLPIALFILVVGGVASPVWAMTDEAPLSDEVTLDEALQARLAVIEQASRTGENAGAASGFFGLSPGQTLNLRLHVTGAHETGDGRWQVHTEELSQIRLDSFVFGYLSEHPMGKEEQIRFILQSGRAITLDLLMLEALLVVDEKPDGELLHIKWKLAASEPSGSATEPIWASRPDVISHKDWKELQNDLYPELLTISYCDCGTDGMEVTWLSNSKMSASSIPQSGGISIADGIVPNENLWVTTGFGILFIAGAIEWLRVQGAKKLADEFF